MAEQYQNLSPVTKSAEDVKPSQARREAEKAGGSGSAQKSGAGNEKRGDKNRAHPMQGKSLDYVQGPGAEAYQEGAYDSDKVNELPHFNR